MLTTLMIFVLLINCDFISAESGDPAVTVFTSKCSKLMKRNPVTNDLFNVVNFPVDVAANAFHDALLTLFIHEGIDKAKKIADYNAGTVYKKFGTITPSQFGDVICRFNGNVMRKRGILTEEDARQLAIVFAEDNADGAKYYDTNTAKGKWKSFNRGFQYFYGRFGLNLDELAKDLTDEFSSALSCVTNNSCM